MNRQPIDLLGAAAKSAPALVRDLVGVAGLGAITWGAYQIYPPAGFIVGGLFAVVGAVLLTLLDQRGGG